MNLNYSKIKILAFTYCILPVLCFFMLYMHSVWGILFGLIVLAMYVSVIAEQKKKQIDDKNINIPFKIVLIMLAITFVWTYLGGHGGHFYQSSDWNIRNAIFRDLIYFKWPVVYEKYGKALVYYIGYWLPSASIVKVLQLLVPALRYSGIAFVIGNQILWCWTVLGMIIVELLLFTYVKPQKIVNQVLMVIMPIIFSGLDIVGVVYKIVTEQKKFYGMHIEWWMDKLQFSSITTCLYWVFNQSVIPWIVILCVMQEKNVKNYVLLGLCALMSGPIPFLGIFTYMVADGVYYLVKAIKEKSVKQFVKDVLGLRNILALVVFPVVYLYYKTNTAINNGASEATTSIGGFLNVSEISPDFAHDIWVFLLWEVGIYFVLIFLMCKKDRYYYMTIVSALIAPFFTVGEGYDFTMRYSVPAIMVLLALCSKALLGQEKDESRNVRIARTCLAIAIIIGSVTSMTELTRGYNVMIANGRIDNTYDNVITLDNSGNSNNFTTTNYQQTIFFDKLTGGR